MQQSGLLDLLDDDSLRRATSSDEDIAVPLAQIVRQKAPTRRKKTASTDVTLDSDAKEAEAAARRAEREAAKNQEKADKQKQREQAKVAKEAAKSLAKKEREVNKVSYYYLPICTHVDDSSAYPRTTPCARFTYTSRLTCYHHLRLSLVLCLKSELVSKATNLNYIHYLMISA